MNAAVATKNRYHPPTDTEALYGSVQSKGRFTIGETQAGPHCPRVAED